MMKGRGGRRGESEGLRSSPHLLCLTSLNMSADLCHDKSEYVRGHTARPRLGGTTVSGYVRGGGCGEDGTEPRSSFSSTE